MTAQGRRLEAGLLVLLLLAWFATWVPRLRGPIDLRWDAAVYYTLGTSLAQGRGYRLLNEPGEIAGVQYPPGLPAIVAIHERVLGTADPVVVGVALRRFYLLVSGLYILAVYWLLRRPFGPVAAAIGAAVCALNMTLVWVSDRAYSDLPYLLATTAFLMFAGRGTLGGRAGAGIAAAAAYLLRTVGAALARQWRRFATRALVTVLLVGAWQGYIWSVERSPEYQSPAYPYQRAPYLLYNVSYGTNASLKRNFFPEQGRVSRRDLAERFVTNVVQVPRTLGEVLTAPVDDWYGYLEWLRRIPVIGLAARWQAIRAGLTLLGLLTLAGLWIQLRQRDVQPVLMAVIYLAGVCVMTVSTDFGRYLSGIQPLVILLLFTTLLPRARTRWREIRYAIFGVVVIAIIAGELATLKAAFSRGMTSVEHRAWLGHDVSYRLFSYDETSRELDEAVDWIARHAAEGDIIASSQPHWVYLRSGRRAVMPPFERDLATQQTLLDAVPVAYVIVDSNGLSVTREYSLPALRDGRHWEQVFRSTGGTTEVYRRRRVLAGS